MDIFTFEDDDVISIDSVFEKEKISPVAEELNRGATLYDERLLLKKKKKTQLKPLYDEARKKKQAFSKIAVYKLICHKPKPKTSIEIDYPKCTHTGNIIIERDILSREEHVTFLAQPKLKNEPIQRKLKMHCYYVKRYLPNGTVRVDELAIPKKKQVIDNMKTFSKYLSARHIDNLTKLILNEDTEYTDIERAINLRREENKKKLVRKARILRESAKVKRKIIKIRKEQVKQITNAIYEIMKPFLMQEHKIEMSSSMQVLSDMLEWRIRAFTGMLSPCDLVDKCIKNLAKNLAIWMDKFITNFGLESLMQPPCPFESEICPCEEKEFRRQLPIDDYIELPVTEELEAEFEGEEYGGFEEWEIGEEHTGTPLDATEANEETESQAEPQAEPPEEAEPAEDEE